MSEFYAIEMYADKDIDPDTFKLKWVKPDWIKVRYLQQDGSLRYMHFDSLEEAQAVASQMVLEDSRRSDKYPIWPFRIVKVVNGVGTVVWLDPRPAALRILRDMRASGLNKFRERLEKL